MRELILGGARSGKSRLAEKRAVVFEALDMAVIYIATAEARDAEMKDRLEHHRQFVPALPVRIRSIVVLSTVYENSRSPVFNSKARNG